MRKVTGEGGDGVTLSCPYLFITSNNPLYLTSLTLLSVGTGSLVRGPSRLGPGVKLLHGSTCYNFPPCVGCVVILYGPMFANCLLAPLRTLTMCQSARFVVIAGAWWDCKMGFPSALEAILLWQLDL
jgi:hypothetical protein